MDVYYNKGIVALVSPSKAGHTDGCSISKSTPSQLPSPHDKARAAPPSRRQAPGNSCPVLRSPDMPSAKWFLCSFTNKHSEI